MITRPLELASKLRPEPRSNDWLHFVNVGLVALFFVLFGSKFVLAPSLGVKFRLPEMVGANADAQPATHHLGVTAAGQIFAPDGVLVMDKLQSWLDARAREMKAAKAPQQPVLLVQASGGVQASLVTEIVGAASRAGFQVRWAAEEPKDVTRGGR
jgi:biopolymer transport protein ExbD